MHARMQKIWGVRILILKDESEMVEFQKDLLIALQIISQTQLQPCLCLGRGTTVGYGATWRDLPYLTPSQLKVTGRHTLEA